MKRYGPLLVALAVFGCSESREDPLLGLATDGGDDAQAPLVDAAVEASARDAGVGAGLVINELRAAGDEWVELYNAGSASVDLSNVQIADTEADGGGPRLSHAMRFPRGTMIAPGQYVVVVANQSDAGAGPQTRCLDGGPTTCFHAEWSLSASRGEAVFVVDPSGAVTASQLYPAMAVPDGQTWGRLPSGTGAFGPNRPTPGATNAAP